MHEHLYDRGHRESMADWNLRQRARIFRKLKESPVPPPGVEWVLTIKGHTPSQIHLDKAPLMPGNQEPRS
jgi:hypothetical protein